MINPTLTQKKEETLTPAQSAKRLFKVIYDEQKKSGEQDDEAVKIKVSNLISKMSFYYEKIRNVIEYKEEHLFRKNAIERILKRQIVIEGIIKESKSEDIAKHLLMELIRAGYLPNNKIPESKIGEVSQVISKYIKLKKYCSESLKSDGKERTECAKWIIALAASDIEERLGRGKIDKTVVKNMYEILFDIIKFPDDSDFEKDKDIQILAGIHSSFLKFDRDMVSFIVFKYYNADWHKADDEDIERVGRGIKFLREKINAQIDHPMAKQLNRIVSRYTVFYTILIDVIDDDPAVVYNSFTADPKAFPRQIKNKCEARYKNTKSKLWRSALRSIIYIFITKSIFAAILEVPAIKWFGGEVNNMSLLINISFPAILLFLIVLFTSLPSKDNTKKIIEGVEEIVFKERGRKEPFQLRRPIRRKSFMNAAFGIIYFVTFFVSFGFIVLSLQRIHFSWISIIIFLFFLALVSFFSIRIRKSTRDLIVVDPKENIISLFSDFFYTPIIAAGKWISEKFSRINVFVFIFDFIIEAPFKIFIEIAEEWTKYVKERREDIV
ncbi:hypothetical protein KKH38_02535 [Patescibacteria group bacterium]|nr:hypothetical protein [Patescibacteria group bacterium]MBU4600615.1 hypothetical protein [Patescibacteria group bacterium]MCG2698542.1 hypothetical protein [Candidatus Parcubacteria bacterium]